MLKKIFYWVFTISQVLFLIIACGIQFFSMKKMGMMRYVLYINQTWEAQYPIHAIQYGAIVFLALVSVIILLYVKIKKINYTIDKKTLSMLIMEVIITVVFVFFTLAYSTESYRSYYFISLILAIIAIIQDIKILVFLKR